MAGVENVGRVSLHFTGSARKHLPFRQLVSHYNEDKVNEIQSSQITL
jgi:hypothetical protein